jgi:hypothetical protein
MEAAVAPQFFEPPSATGIGGGSSSRPATGPPSTSASHPDGLPALVPGQSEIEAVEASHEPRIELKRFPNTVPNSIEVKT